jgi:hypothetical protein
MHQDIVELKSKLKELLQKKPQVLAAWEGGSAATGFLDDYSDLDLGIVTDKDLADELFGLIEEFFCADYGIIAKFRMPEPAWHGMSQCFYLLDKLPPLFYCDIAIVPQDNPHKFTEPDRHGNAVIWFDKAAVYKSDPTPREELDAIANRVYKMATDTAFLGTIELQKALARKNWMAASMNFTTFVYRHLVPLLNRKYRPAKADFGIRYAERDYPAREAEKLANLLKNRSVQDIEENYAIAQAWFKSVCQELQTEYQR